MSERKISLNELLERLCPQLRRQHWRAAIRSSGGQAIFPELHEADIRSTIARLEAQAGSTKTYGHALKIVEAEAIRDAKKAAQQEAATIAAQLQHALSDALRDKDKYRFIAVGEDGKEQDIQPRSADRCRWYWGLGFAVLSSAAPGGRETILHDVHVELLAEPSPDALLPQNGRTTGAANFEVLGNASGARSYSKDEPHPQFLKWAADQTNAGIVIRQGEAVKAMQDQTRLGKPPEGPGREMVRGWVRKLPSDWTAKHGAPPPAKT